MASSLSRGLTDTAVSTIGEGGLFCFCAARSGWKGLTLGGGLRLDPLAG